MGKYQGRLAADAIAGRDVRLRSDGARSPRVIFTDPQVASVGLTLAGAEKAGLSVRHVEVETGGNGGGSFIGRGAAGTARMIVDEDRRRDRGLHGDRAPRSPRRCTPRRSP